VRDALHAHGLERHFVVRTTNSMLVPLLVARTDLVATIPARTARAFAATHPIRIVEAPVPLPDFVVTQTWHPRDDHDPGHRWLRELVTEVGREV
jgi:DNA-binding transcriptional LysR family regulator